MVARHGSFALLALLAGGCDVPPPPPGTGGVDVVDVGSCEGAVTVVCSDYMSTDIAISALDGTPLSGSFVSSGSAAAGLALALSGDVDVPLVAPASRRVVILDRYGTNVLTWMDPVTAKVIQQLPVGTGFQSNPHDYVEVDATRAFVSRYGTNPTPGQEPFDEGGDLLVVDTTQFTILGRIPMPEDDPALQPCPDTMTWMGSDVVVTLGRWSADFTQIGDGRFVGVSPASSTVDWTVDVTGLQNCGRVAVSPSGATAAIACTSKENRQTNSYEPAQSDIVIYDATQTPPVEKRRLGLGVKLDSGIQPQIAFAEENVIVGLTYGGNANPGDTVFAVDLTDGSVAALAEETQAYVLGGVHCAPGCGDVCLIGDAERGVLRRFQFAPDGSFSALDDAPVDPTIGLPPRDIGGLR